ncbi:hypothetical protein NDU88_005203, partial [Pleurodeles waltl]
MFSRTLKLGVANLGRGKRGAPRRLDLASVLRSLSQSRASGAAASQLRVQQGCVMQSHLLAGHTVSVYSFQQRRAAEKDFLAHGLCSRHFIRHSVRRPLPAPAVYFQTIHRSQLPATGPKRSGALRGLVRLRRLSAPEQIVPVNADRDRTLRKEKIEQKRPPRFIQRMIYRGPDSERPPKTAQSPL